MPTFTTPNSFSEPLSEINHCHEPAGSGKGGYFAPKNSGVCSSSGGGIADPSHQLPAHQSPLLSADVVSSESLGGGVNLTMMVDMQTEDGETVQAVYKPEAGEEWGDHCSFSNGDIHRFVTNREFSLAEREAAAYEVDQILGTDVVPETVHRHEVDVEVPEPNSSNSDDYGDEGGMTDEYNRYREKAQDQAMEVVGEEMQRLYDEEADEHVRDVERRGLEMNDIWNEVVDEHPEAPDGPNYGTDIDSHPLLGGWESPGDLMKGDVKHRGGKVLDPHDLIEEADIDVSSKLSKSERASLKALMTRALVYEGYDEFGDVDSERAKESFKEYGDWIEDHSDTEMRLIDQQIMSRSKWAEANGMGRSEGSGNDQAPHPRGGSLQRFMQSGWGNATDEQNTRVAVLDYVIGSMDRHPGNVLISEGGKRVWAIDNGYSFPSSKDARLKSAPARSLLRGMEDAPRRALHGQISRADWAAFFKRHPSISEDERGAFLSRVGRLKTALSTPDGLYELWQKASRGGNY